MRNIMNSAVAPIVALILAAGVSVALGQVVTPGDEEAVPQRGDGEYVGRGERPERGDMEVPADPEPGFEDPTRGEEYGERAERSDEYREYSQEADGYPATEGFRESMHGWENLREGV